MGTRSPIKSKCHTSNNAGRGYRWKGCSTLLKLRAAWLVLMLFLTFPIYAEANDLEQLQDQIDAFKQSKHHSFAAQTIERANAYLGAAMLASEQNKTDDVKNAMDQARAKIAEAKQTATTFRARFSELIYLRQDTLTTVEMVAISVQREGSSAHNPSDKKTILSAQKEFDQAIYSFEQGQLNQAQAHASKAQQYFQQIMAETIPRLTELTASAIGKAANSGAKKYAPQMYQAAKDKMAELRAFSDGLSQLVPRYPGQGVDLARAAKQMAEQVKLWRKKSGSHEAIVLKQRAMNMKLADILQLSTANNPMLEHIDANDLLLAIQKNQQALLDERQTHRQKIVGLKEQAAEEMQRKLVAQTDAMQQTQKNQMSTIKDAFRAKLERSAAILERETFDQKRQQKLHGLFKQGEVEILVNLDGSLLIRLSSLKFFPAKSKIETSYFDMLARLNEAMSIYEDRSFRIEGHTDDRGDVKPNQILSLKRAEAVRDFLIASGADGSRLKALGYGEVRPVASNEFAQGRAMNRRIDIVIAAKK
ncbi:MAG: OmpA family protein [Mariprofundus sp.]|nr:OmpA family protein [Mariprofundus sp.]